jgi:hypothetical protein
MRPARIRARRPSGLLDLFLADDAKVVGGFVVAVGRWRGSRSRGEYAFPSRRVVEVRWEVTA